MLRPGSWSAEAERTTPVGPIPQICDATNAATAPSGDPGHPSANARRFRRSAPGRLANTPPCSTKNALPPLCPNRHARLNHPPPRSTITRSRSGTLTTAEPLTMPKASRPHPIRARGFQGQTRPRARGDPEVFAAKDLRLALASCSDRAVRLEWPSPDGRRRVGRPTRSGGAHFVAVRAYRRLMGLDAAIDITFDFRSDTPAGEDPDARSPTLRRYHQLLWSKPLQRAGFELDVVARRSACLHHRYELGDFVNNCMIPAY